MSRLENPPDGNYFEHTEYPVIVRAHLIPPSLKEYPRPQWVCWRYVFREEGQRTLKVPVNPHNLHNAGVHWKNTWSTFEQAYTTYLKHRANGLGGIGFVLTQDDAFIGVDVDNCVTEDSITEPALEVIQTLESYTEVSPSGQGIRILVSSPNYRDNFKSKELEIYSHSRFLTLTGNRVDGSPLEITNVDPSTLQSLRPLQQPPHTTSTINTPSRKENKLPGTSDAQLWARIFEHDQYGEAHRQRFMGSTSLDQEDHSLVVMRLLNALARWSGGDATRMRSMMLMSPLANEKWLNKRGKGDWLDYQIADAIRYVKRGK